MGSPVTVLFLYTLGAAFVSVCAITVQTPKKSVEAARGASATLPCSYQTTVADKTGSNVMWKKLPDQDEVISAFYGSINTTGSAYDGRVAFTGNVYGSDATIALNQLTMADNGTYQCEVTIPGDRKGTPFAKLDLVVLVAPSKPDCAIVGTAEYGQVIKLTCSSNEGSPIPTYAWKSYTPQDVSRTLPLTSVTEGGELTLKNISMDTSGFFICTSSNKVGSDFCNLTLAVMPPSMNIALYAGAIGGSVAGIIVIGIIAYCCCCRDREDKEDYEMAEREDEEEEPPQHQAEKPTQHHDKGPPQPQQYYDDDDDDHESVASSKPPLPQGNKPRLVIDPVVA